MKRKRKHKITVYKGKGGKFWWRCQAGNNRIVGASEQGYANKSYAIKKGLAAYPDAVVVEA